ncbi:hypothetical protein [Metabacillus sp. 22489]|uniref:hypothetical protein n=1 Tax=Metabacillus sp. 22489 TaxID=3453928 RepID=UPI003F87A05A
MPIKTKNCDFCPNVFVIKNKTQRRGYSGIFKGDPVYSFYYVCPGCNGKNVVMYDTPKYYKQYIRLMTAKSKEEREIAKNELEKVRNEIEEELKKEV